jgi:hypothetical protein
MQATRREDGAVLVELALVLVPLLFLVFGFLQFGMAMNAKIDSTHLTAEGARYIAVNQNPGLSESPATTMQDYIRSRADTPYLKDTAQVCISYPTNPETGTSGKVGDPVKVALDITYLKLFNTLPMGLALPDLPVTSEATMRLEALPTKVPSGCTL